MEQSGFIYIADEVDDVVIQSGQRLIITVVFSFLTLCFITG